MKKICVLLVFLLMCVSKVSFAQLETTGRKTAEQRSEIITKNLTTKLSLTPAQSAEAYELVLRREKLRDAGKLSKEKQKEIHSDLNKILTKEQQKVWKESKRKE